MSNNGPTEGEEWYGKEVLDIIDLSEDDWKIYRVAGDLSENDFIVKMINQHHPRGIKIKYAHFAIDFFGKLMQDKEAGLLLFDGLVDIWHGATPETVLEDVGPEISHLKGYDPDFIFYALNWILEQEDINYTPGNRDSEKQEEIDNMLSKMDIDALEGREGSQLAISMFSDIADGQHPVEAFYRVDITI